jgi:non-ribosomal peptide synthetase component E (peptide arylation enzyme)
VNTALHLTSIRPASGRSLVRVWACGGFDGMPSVRPNQHQSHVYSAKAAASLRVGKNEDQVLPGGGCA